MLHEAVQAVIGTLDKTDTDSNTMFQTLRCRHNVTQAKGGGHVAHKERQCLRVVNDPAALGEELLNTVRLNTSQSVCSPETHVGTTPETRKTPHVRTATVWMVRLPAVVGTG